MTINWHEFFEYDGLNLIRKPIGNKNSDPRWSGTVSGCKVAGNGTTYIHVKFFGIMYYAHRIIWEMKYGDIPDDMYIDHIDGNGMNNRLSNFRLVTNNDNAKNKKLHKNNKSGVSGITWYKKLEKWTVRIGVNGKEKHLGYFEDFFEAVCRRKSAEVEFGYHINHGRKT